MGGEVRGGGCREVRRGGCREINGSLGGVGVHCTEVRGVRRGG